MSMEPWRPDLLKAEIHCHIEAAAHPDVVRGLAKKYSVDLSKVISDDGYHWSDFSEFMASYFAVSDVLRWPDDYAELTHDYLRRQAAAGVIYQEFFCSHDNADRMGCTYYEMVEGIAEGAALAKAESGIEARIINTGVRNHGVDFCIEAAELAAKYAHPLVTGFGIAGDERFLAHKDFAQAFKIAGEAGLNLTAHAGEICGPESVSQAIDEFGICRVGHGVHAIEDPAVVERCVAENIVFETCPGSNVLLTEYDTWEKHPFNRLHEVGAVMTLSSDDPWFFQTTTDREYMMASQTWGYSDEQLLGFTLSAINAAFCDDATKQKLRQKIAQI